MGQRGQSLTIGNSPIFENILTHRNSECDAFVAGKRGRCEKGLPDNFGVLSGPSAAVRLERRGGM
jgi:hypothetical protein